MNRLADLAKLGQLAGVVYESERAALLRLADREAGIHAQLRDLNAARAAQSTAERSADEPAMIAKADMRWHRWIDQRREVLNRELAQVLALKSQQQMKLQTAFGRHQATLKLAQRAAAKAKADKERRAGYMS